MALPLIAGRTIGSLLFNRYTLALVGVAVILFGIWRGIDEISDAGKAAGAAEERARGLEQTVVGLKADVEGWRQRFAKIDAQDRSDASALADRTAELQRAADDLARRQKELRDALKNLEGLDATCAAHPVPNAVDGVLGR